jgi:hypothetical protein
VQAIKSAGEHWIDSLRVAACNLWGASASNDQRDLSPQWPTPIRWMSSVECPNSPKRTARFAQPKKEGLREQSRITSNVASPSR